MKLPNWTYLVVFAIGILCSWYFMKGCDKADTGLIDTIKVLSAKNDSIAVAAKSISLHNDSITIAKKKGDSVYQHKLDSQSHIIAIWQGRFGITKDSIGVLYGKLRDLYLANDTVELASAYHELGYQLQDARTQLSALQSARDSADLIRDGEVSRLNGIIDQLQAEIKQLEGLLVDCTNNASALAKTGLKAARKAKIAALISKIGIGLSAVLAVILLSHK